MKTENVKTHLCRRGRNKTAIFLEKVTDKTRVQGFLASSAARRGKKFLTVIMSVPTMRAAFSLIELMVAVSLMTLIVLGLVVMFAQTQKAFRTSMTQTDMLEAGRIQIDMMARELSQIAPSGRAFTTNLFVQLSSRFNPPLLQGMPGTTKGGPGTQDQRTNIVQSIFFLSQNNQNWTGTGYVVIPDSGAGVGTLYRFYTNHGIYTATNMSSEFLNAQIAGLNRISDGVVHLRLRAFATNGYPILWDGFRTNGIFRTNAFSTGTLRVRNTLAYNPLPSVPDAVDCYFMSNALPAYLELEVGILEKQVLERFRSIGSANVQAQLRYLSNHVGQVHIFRQRIPVRTVDFSAYQ